MLAARAGWLTAWAVTLCVLACEEPAVFETGGGPGSDEPSSCDEPTLVPERVASALDVDRDFYVRHCSALGIDVLGADGVSDAAMLEAGRILEGLLSELPEVRDAMHDRYFRVVIVASSRGQQLRDVPELPGLRKAENAAAGIGPDPSFPAATVRDTVVVCRPREQDALATPPGDTLVHEIAHGILDMGLRHTDEDFRDRLEAAYDQARADDRWEIALPPVVTALFGEQPTENYLMHDAKEYWATGVSAWHGFKPIPLAYGLSDHDPPRLRLEVSYGRDALAEHDPDLASLLEEVFGQDPALRPSCDAWVPKFDLE